MSQIKRKGGAEKIREKKQQLLVDSAKSSQNIKSIFSNQKILTHETKQGK